MVEATRTAMSEFWAQFTESPSEKEMMLDRDAKKLSREEVPEILALLPDYAHKDVLELGAGIGRFTGKLAEQARSVLAVDFMESFVQKNRDSNSHLSNVTFRQADVTELDLEDNSVDLVFSNWLLMYLRDEEVRTLMTKVLHWLKPDGKLFFRESCFHPSGNMPVPTNPTRYRTPSAYYDILMSVATPTDNGGTVYGYQVIMQRAVQTYVKLKSNRNQVCWSFQKVRHTESHQGNKSFEYFRDNRHAQCSRSDLLRREKIFGRHYVRSEGKQMTQEFVKMLDLKPDQNVLDLGCGIGGSTFYMTETFGVNVLGIEFSSNMINLALERLNEMSQGLGKEDWGTPDQKVQLEVRSASEATFPDESFDAIYTRDSILNVPDRMALLGRFLDWLRPGGKLFISEYCFRGGERGGTFVSLRHYGKALEEIGFVRVRTEERTEQFRSAVRADLARAEETKKAFVHEFSERDYGAIVEELHDIIDRFDLGGEHWGLVYAQKLQPLPQKGRQEVCS